MSVIYSAATKTARMTAVLDQIDAGPGNGKIEIGTAAMALVLLTVNLNKPCGVVSGPVLTLSGFPKTQAAVAGGTPAAARIRDSNNNDIVTGLTAGLSGTDIILDSATLTNGQSTTIASATLTHA